MPNINLDDAYILDETGAQVDKVTGLFTKDEDTTSGEKAFAQLNIGTAGSNRNLLDNPWFTVRQKGNGPFGAGAGYTVDRWTKFYNGIITGTDEGVSITPNATSGWIEFAQYLPADVGAALEGKTLTLSALLQDGTLYSKSGVCAAKPSSGTTNFITVSMPNSMGFVAGRRNDGALRVEFTYGQAYSQDPLNVRAVKLELGPVSTLANDAPPKESQVTDDCKWYFQRIQQEDGYTAPVGFGIVTASTTILRTLIPLSSPLRKAGTLTATATNIGQMRVQGNGSNLTPTAITGRGVLNGHAVVDITVNGTLTANQVYTLVFANSTAIIELSKDL